MTFCMNSDISFTEIQFIKHNILTFFNADPTPTETPTETPPTETTTEIVDEIVDSLITSLPTPSSAPTDASEVPSESQPQDCDHFLLYKLKMNNDTDPDPRIRFVNNGSGSCFRFDLKWRKYQLIFLSKIYFSNKMICFVIYEVNIYVR